MRDGAFCTMKEVQLSMLLQPASIMFLVVVVDRRRCCYVVAELGVVDNIMK